ncbi:MAG: SDR family NAD(P)-dependent oxidoreductase [Polyangiaceae bacterium]
MTSSRDQPPGSSGNRPLPITRRSLMPPASQGPSSSHPPPTTQQAGGSNPPARGEAPPPSSRPGGRPAPPVAPPWQQEPPRSVRSPSIPPPSAAGTTPLPNTSSTKGTLPASVQKALVTLDKLKAKLDQVERQKTEPVAVIGMACRFPAGANSPEAFFRMLEEGVDAVSRVPDTRWSEAERDPAAPVHYGAFLKEDVGNFDAAFFNISPREAERLDPQQRLLLELTWEALERAGQVPSALVGSRTGVFVGLMTTDYMLLNMEAPAESWDVYTATGTTHCFPAGRISYSMGFQGPAMVVDTACSSSLVAVHLACQSLRTGESELAVAGGANLMLSPAMFDMMAKTNALAPDGRCKTFDARADGYVRGEGGGVVVLKRLSDAQRDGDPILALIRGSAVNQDGRSTGLTTPNVLSQQAMLRQALESAHLTGADIGYVETHGTGTSLGDPIEVDALRAVLGAPREDGHPCVLGAVKTNIGHLEAAAGIAGLLKVILSLQKERIPKNLHLRAVNPRMSLAGTPFVLPTENRRWERGERPRIAGVSAFGLSGTNAHILVEEAPAVAPETEEAAATDGQPQLLPLSAKTPAALVEVASSLSEALARGGESLADVSYTLRMRRTHHEHRLAVVGTTRKEVAEALSMYASTGSAPGVVRGKAGQAGRQKLVFVFPGQGGQWIGMARGLVQREPAFRSSIELCHEAIRRHGTFSLLDELEATEATSRIREIDVVQPLIFAVQVSLVALLASWGIEPDLVIGHSMGEVAAARAAGILTIEDAAKVICRRSRLLVRIAGQGAMAQVELSAEDAQAAIAKHRTKLAVAVRNGPRTTVLSGDPGALEEVLAELEAAGVFCRRVKVDVASHSPQVDILKEDLAAVLFNLRPRLGKTPMLSTVTGDMVRGPELTADYWVKNLREPVLFAPATRRALDERQAVFVEISPHPILTNAIDDNLQSAGHEGVAFGCMRRDTDARRTLLEAVGALHAQGVAIDWKRAIGAKGRTAPLPPYPWQRRRYWIPDVGPSERGTRRPSPASRLRASALFTSEWRPAERPTKPSPAMAGPWLLLSDRSATADALIEALRDVGIPFIRGVIGQRTARLERDLWEVNPSDPEAYTRLLESAFPPDSPCRVVVSMFGADPGGDASVQAIERAQVLGVESALLVAQAILRTGAVELPRLWLVTRGVAAIPGEPGPNVAQAPLWGFGRTLQTEHGDLGVRLLDLANAPWDGEADAMLDEILHQDAEDQIALRPSGRMVARLIRDTAAPAAPAVTLRADGTYLVTGGLGGLGLSLAEWMVGRGARHLMLVGRSAPSRAAQEAIGRMESAGAKVLVVSADVGVRAEVEALVERIRLELPPLRGVVHAAAVLDDHTVLKLSVTSLREVAAAKMYGAWHLHEATRGRPLDLFVMYGSAAALLGPMGQANYAAANAFLDALALKRRAEGLPALAIDWGPFAEVGLAAARSNRGERLEAMGFRGMSPAQGHELLGALLGAPHAEVAVLDVDMERAAEAIPRLATAPFFASLAAAGAPRPPDTPRLLEIVRQTPAGERRQALEKIVREELARCLRIEAADVGLEQPFAELGFDSLMGLELRNRLQAGLALQLSVADIVTHTRVTALAELLHDRLGITSGPASRPPTSRRPARAATGSWVVVPRPSPGARARLFCFPYAGGAAPVFAAWPEEMPPDIEVCAIQLPGRHERLHEPLLQSVEQIVESLVPALLPYLDRPFATFGHCLGSIVMFEALRVLASRHGKRPAHVFASAAPAPHRYLVPTVGSLSTREFTDVLRTIGFADELVLTDKDAQQTMLPAVRTDFDVAARYAYRAGPPLDAPITAFAGLQDGFAPIDLVDEWRQQTSSRFAKVAFPGGHYFIVPERRDVLAHVRTEILHRLAAIEVQQRDEPPVSGADPWVVHVAPRPSPAARLVCFCGIGETAREQARWAGAVGPDVEVCAIELPGHGARANEMPLGRVEDMVPRIVASLQVLADRPFAFVGTDLGALIAFEAAAFLAGRGGPLPVQIVVASAMAPGLHYFAPIHLLPQEPFLAELTKLGLSTAETPERALRADCAAFSAYALRGAPPVEVPILAFGGELDWFIPLGGIRGWGAHTLLDFAFESRRAGHFLSEADREKVAVLLRKRFGLPLQ